MRHTAGSFVRAGWEIFKKRPLFLIGVELAITAALYVFGMFTALFQFGSIVSGHPFIGILIPAALNVVIQFIAGVCILTFSLRAHDSIETVQPEDIWHTENFWKYVSAYFLYMLSIIAGSILLIIPGIIASVTFIYAPYLAIDKGLGPVAAMKESARITRGSRWRVLVLSAAIGFIYLAGVLALFLGILVAYPVAKLAFVNAYRRMTTEVDAQMPKLPLTMGEKGVFAGYLLSFVGVMALVFFLVTHVMMAPKNLYPNIPGFLVRPSDQPAESIAPMNVARVPFTVFTLTNNTDHLVTVSGVKVELSALEDAEAISEVALIDESGEQLGNWEKFDEKMQANIGGIFTVPINTTKTYTVAADISACEHVCPQNEKKVGISVLNIYSTTTLDGIMPIVGTRQQLNSNIRIGQVFATILSQGTPTGMIAGTIQSVSFSEIRLVPDSTEDLRLYVVRFKYVGSSNDLQLSNLHVRINDQDYPATWDSDNTVQALIPGGALIKGGGPTLLSLGGDYFRNPGDGEVVFKLIDPSDMYFVGQLFGYGIYPVIDKNHIR